MVARARFWVCVNAYALLLDAVGLMLLAFAVMMPQTWFVAAVSSALLGVGLIYGGIGVHSTYDEKRRIYSVLLKRNARAVQLDTFRDFMTVPCHRLVVRMVLHRLNCDSEYETVKRRFYVSPWRRKRGQETILHVFRFKEEGLQWLVRQKAFSLFLIMASIGLLAAEVPTADRATADAAMDTIAQINHINWVVSKIKTYNSALVLEDEYRQISPDKLNLNRIPDQEALQRIVAMLDLLHDMLKDERELRYWKMSYEARRKRKQLDFWKGQYADLKTGVGPLGFGGIVPGASAVYSVSKFALAAYRDYDDFVHELEAEAVRKKFEIETVKLDRLHALNKALLQSQWKMIQDYGFDDSLRVSDSDIAIFIEALKDPDHHRVYARIEAMREKFKIFPVYWYFLSSVALETEHREDALRACNRFFEVNRGLFRDDPTVGAVAMNKAFLLPKDDAHRDEIRTLLELVRKRNAGIVDWRKDYFCAALYSTCLGDRESAAKALSHAMSALEYAVSEHLHAIVNLVDTTDVPSSGIEFADGESLWLCRQLMSEISSGQAVYNEEGLKKLCERKTASAIDKLAYVGKMASPKIWAALKPDVAGITLQAQNRLSWKGVASEVAATIPLRWLLSGEFAIELVAVQGEDVVQTYGENRGKRSLTTEGKVKVVFSMPKEKEALSKADALRLCLRHPDYPVELTFASGTPYKGASVASAPGLILNDGDFNDGHLLDDLRLMTASFCGKSYCYAGAGREFAVEGNRGWKDVFRLSFPNIRDYACGAVKVQANGVDEVEFQKNGLMQIRYQNQSTEKLRPAVSIYLLNRYGAVLRRVDDIWKFKKLKPGERFDSEWFVGAAHAAFYDIETGR